MFSDLSFDVLFFEFFLLLCIHHLINLFIFHPVFERSKRWHDLFQEGTCPWSRSGICY